MPELREHAGHHYAIQCHYALPDDAWRVELSEAVLAPASWAEIPGADVALHARSPRNNPQWPTTGTFVHRNHRRPNQLAQSFPRLLKVDGLDLHVTDLDAIYGSPVYDLAPYFREMGPRGEVREPAWPGEMLADYWDTPQS
jgi:tRNA (Thr-GGU) A37 N-methylase